VIFSMPSVMATQIVRLTSPDARLFTCLVKDFHNERNAMNKLKRLTCTCSLPSSAVALGILAGILSPAPASAALSNCSVGRSRRSMCRT
jgi:hypothetical protein